MFNDMFATKLDRINAVALNALPLLARFTFAAVLLRYFWTSALTKLERPLTPILQRLCPDFSTKNGGRRL